MLRGEERRSGEELRWGQMRGQREGDERCASDRLESHCATRLLDSAPHRLDALQALALGQQGFIDDDHLTLLYRTMLSFLHASRDRLTDVSHPSRARQAL